MNTADPLGAREHARSQAGRAQSSSVVATQPTIPAEAAPDLPPSVSPETAVAWLPIKRSTCSVC